MLLQFKMNMRQLKAPASQTATKPHPPKRDQKKGNASKATSHSSSKTKKEKRVSIFKRGRGFDDGSGTITFASVHSNYKWLPMYAAAVHAASWSRCW